MKYVVDTCIINKLVDGKIDPASLPTEGGYVATHIQIDELKATKDEKRRDDLLKLFNKTVEIVIPTESTCLDISRLGQCKLSDGDLFGSLKSELDNLNKRRSNNEMDALIAELAITNGYTLLTTDKDLEEVTRQHGCEVIYWDPNTGERKS